MASSRRIAQRLHGQDIAFRAVGGESTITGLLRTISANFRKDNLERLSGLFVQVLALCSAGHGGSVKLGRVVDGTKVKANACHLIRR